MEQDLHVVFGAGQVGTPLAQLLLSRGKRVRIVRRGSGTVAGVEVMRGDAADAAFCRAAAAGAAVVYHCMNPPYDRKAWAEFVPRHVENLVAAAGAADARLVVLENLYMLGRTGGRAMDEDTPMNPCSVKGGIRAHASELLFAAHARGDVRAVSGRAADFYGPGGRLTFFGDHFWKPALSGRRVSAPMNVDTPHTCHYIPDVAAGLAALGCAEDDVLGRPWMLPCRPAESTRQLIARLAQALGRPIAIAPVPRAMLVLLGLFVPVLSEIREMLYQWDEPFVVDDRRFRARFEPLTADAADAACATVAWARTAYPQD
jgi:nucleoside-diphosphate-sugar epimerase